MNTRNTKRSAAPATPVVDRKKKGKDGEQKKEFNRISELWFENIFCFINSKKNGGYTCSNECGKIWMDR